MKRFWVIVAVIVVAAGLYLLLRPKNPPAQNGVVSETSSNLPVAQGNSQNGNSASPNGAAATTTAQNELALRATSPNPAADSTASTNEEPTLPPLTILDKARVVMHNYRTAFGENPVGINPEITAALMGKNPRQINFVADSGLRVNKNGEMVDGYGTPFFFHQISGREMEIRSAGEDRVMWTKDDLVTR